MVDGGQRDSTTTCHPWISVVTVNGSGPTVSGTWVRVWDHTFGSQVSSKSIVGGYATAIVPGASHVMAIKAPSYVPLDSSGNRTDAFPAPRSWSNCCPGVETPSRGPAWLPVLAVDGVADVEGDALPALPVTATVPVVRGADASPEEAHPHIAARAIAAMHTPRTLIGTPLVASTNPATIPDNHTRSICSGRRGDPGGSFETDHLASNFAA